MSVKSLLATAVLLLASTASHAGVVYEWVTVSNNMPINNPRMRIELEEGAVRNGSFSLNVGPETPTIPNTGLVSFRYSEMSLSPGHWNPTAFGYLSMNLSFVDNNFFMTGSIRVSDFGTRLHASSDMSGSQDNRLWTIHNTDGDSLIPCYSEPNRFCEGATGYFRQVPEPAPFALLGLGALTAFAARRKKQP